MIKAVVFDLDDTLFPEIDYVFSGLKVVADTLFPQNADYVLQQLKDLLLIDKNFVFNRFFALKDKAVTDEKVKTALSIYKNHRPAIRLFPDVLPVLNGLKKQGYLVGLISDGVPAQQNAKLDALKIRDYFDAVVLSDELGGPVARKPSLIPFEAVRSKFRLEWEQFIYIGDNPTKDFYVGEKGAVTVRIVRQNGLYSDLEYYNGIAPKYTIRELNGIKKILEDEEGENGNV